MKKRGPEWLNRFKTNFPASKNLQHCHSSVVSSAPTIMRPWVRIPSTRSMLLSFIVFVLYLSCEKNENKRKRGREWAIFIKKPFNANFIVSHVKPLVLRFFHQSRKLHTLWCLHQTGFYVCSWIKLLTLFWIKHLFALIGDRTQGMVPLKQPPPPTRKYCWTLIAHKVELHIMRIVLKNIIYL